MVSSGHGLRFTVLGRLEVWDGDEPLDLGPFKQRCVLAMLLAHANEVVSADRLIDGLWGDDIDLETTKKTLWVYISRLRSILEPSRSTRGQSSALLTRDKGYVLALEPDQVDATRFERLVAAARPHLDDDQEAVSRLLSEGLEMWRGPAYEDFRYESFAQAEIARLEEIHLEAITDRIDADVSLGRTSGLVGELDSLVRNFPLDERLAGQLMQVLHQSGRQADALVAYERIRRALGEELGIEPSRTLRGIEQAILLEEEASGSIEPAVRPVRRHNLRAEMTTFIGREKEVRGAVDALGETRVLTLTGMGGVGKTRIALRLAAQVVDRFPDGVWVAELASATSPAGVREAIARALLPTLPDLPQSVDELTHQVADKALLLVLDNCEHLISECAWLARELLESGKAVKILATSREPLDIPGESVWPVSAMVVPDPTLRGLTADALEGFDAVRLFMDRAQAANPSFSLVDENKDYVARICWRVDGLPLALELAATRVRSMTVAEIASGLDNVFDLLKGRSRTSSERHRTLQATLDWSFDLLDEEERQVLSRLAAQPAFDLAFPRKAAQVIGAGDGVDESDVLDVLGRLVDTSWIVMEEDHGHASYHMLQTVREFVYAKKEPDLLVEHRVWVIALAQRTDPELRGSDTEMWSALLDGDYRTVRSALDAAFEHHAIEEGTFLAGAAAALMSRTGNVAFIGAVKISHIERFLEGFAAGARHIEPDIAVEARYLSAAPDDSGTRARMFHDRARMRDVATSLYEDDVDVALHAAGAAGAGLFDAALRTSETTGEHKWGIGVDFDWYYDVTEAQANHVLTSVRLQIPRSSYRALKAAVGAGDAVLPRFDLASNAVTLASSGSHLDGVINEIELLRRQIISGEIDVPVAPA